MPYKVKNLIGSKGAPSARKARRDKILKAAFSALRIGNARLLVGDSRVISDDAYENQKEMLEHLHTLGAVSIENIGGSPAEPESKKSAPKPAPKPAPKKVEPAPAVVKKAEETISPKEDVKVEEKAVVTKAPVKAPVKKAPVVKPPVKKAPIKKTPSPKEAAKKRAAAAKASKESN